MKDILGIRVICRNLSSLENVYQILLHSTEIEFFESMEKRWIEESDNGYRGIHLVFTAKAGTLCNSELKGEIQLRTIAQHYWATFSHHDIYKEQPILLYRAYPKTYSIHNHQEFSLSFSMIVYSIDCSKYEIQKSDFEFRDRLIAKICA